MVLIGTATAEVNPFTRIAFIQKAFPTEVQAAIDAGWDVNEIDPRFGETALINSIRVKRLDITRLLIEADADLDYHPPRKTSFPAALLLASYKGNVEAARLLLDAGADIEIRTETSGYTPLLYAAMSTIPMWYRFCWIMVPIQLSEPTRMLPAMNANTAGPTCRPGILPSSTSSGTWSISLMLPFSHGMANRKGVACMWKTKDFPTWRYVILAIVSVGGRYGNSTT